VEECIGSVLVVWRWRVASYRYGQNGYLIFEMAMTARFGDERMEDRHGEERVRGIEWL
jgi:hypothetical protein